MDKKVYLIKSDTDYAMRMLVFLALNVGAGPVAAGVMVETQNIPVDFAYKILQRLCKANILKSYKGFNGGFLLAKEPEDIRLLDVINAVQGRILARPCLLDRDNSCPMVKSCLVSSKLRNLQDMLDAEMAGITLAKIIMIKPNVCG